MNIVTLYVGQGALAVARNGGEAVIVDSLLPGSEGLARPRIEEKLERLLHAHVAAGLILTGFDSDHCCPDGVELILSKYEPAWIMYPKYYKDTDCAAKVFEIIERYERRRESSGRPLRRVSVRLDRLNSRTLMGLSPQFQFELFSPHLFDMDNSNNSSIVLKLTGNGTSGFSYLITGDTENERWDRINGLFRGALRSDVLAAPHHGSRNGTNAGTLLLVEPNTVLISAGVDNPYGHPDPQAVHAYAKVAKHVFATNVEDGVSLYTKANGGDFETLLVH